MNPERIKALIDLMAESDLCELSLTEGDSQLRLLREAGRGVPAPVGAPLRPAPSGEGQTVCASLYGVLHLTPAPDQPPFVQLGERVEAGQTLAVIEAMKMFHPLKATLPGTLGAILAASGDEVEAGQAVFRLD